MNTYETIKLDKSMYNAPEGFAGRLEKLDPSKGYEGGDLAGLDAYQRQLKRFGIRVSGAKSDPVAKFYSTADSTALFPEYVTRAVSQGLSDAEKLSAIIASKTNIDSMDYRSITSGCDYDPATDTPVSEGGALPVTQIQLKENLVRMKKRGRILSASYEAIRFQRLDVFTVALRQIGASIARRQMLDAVDVLVSGDGNQNPAEVISASTAGTLAYKDLLEMWSSFEEFELNTLIVSPVTMRALLELPEFKDPATGLNFQATGALDTPIGAKLIKTSAVPEGKIIGLDRRFALEMVTAGDIQVEYDKLIDTQLERAAVSCIYGFSKIFPEAVKVLKI